MQTLDLDAFASAQRTVTIGGNAHEVREMSVGDFIEAQADLKRLKDEEQQDVATVIRHVARVIPTLGEAGIRALNPNQLNALLNFVNTTIDAASKDPEATVSGN